MVRCLMLYANDSVRMFNLTISIAICVFSRKDSVEVDTMNVSPA